MRDMTGEMLRPTSADAARLSSGELEPRTPLPRSPYASASQTNLALRPVSAPAALTPLCLPKRAKLFDVNKSSLAAASAMGSKLSGVWRKSWCESEDMVRWEN